jgi:undecaprenyl-diphosphatase
MVLAVFAVASRLGDGVFWYSLMLLLPLLFGTAGLAAAVQLAAAGIIGTVLYRQLKERLARERPCNLNPRIRAGARPLDRYSFPSGHTLHAVSFTVIALASFPVLAGVLAPFAVLVAASRVILGLHYPSDVVAGAVLGLVIAKLVLFIAA